MQSNLLKSYQILTRSKDLVENLSLKLLCDVIFHCCRSIQRFIITANLELDEYPWKPKFLNNSKLELKASN